MDPNKTPEIKTDNLAQCTMRWGLLVFAWINVALGMIGVIIPGMPTTVFLLIAVWAFSKSSVRFQRWLWEHKTFGPSIQAWHNHRVIPMKAKVMASSMMTISFLYVTFFVADGWLLSLMLAGVLVPSAAFILSQASNAPDPAPESGEPS